MCVCLTRNLQLGAFCNKYILEDMRIEKIFAYV